MLEAVEANEVCRGSVKAGKFAISIFLNKNDLVVDWKTDYIMVSQRTP